MHNKLYFTVIFYSLIFNVLVAQNQANYKYWQLDSLLIWDDFASQKNKLQEHSASSNCNIYFYFDIKDDTMLFEVKTYFDREKSWKLKHVNNLELLDHEQIHFTIAELYARKLRKELCEFEIPERSLTDTVKLIYKRNIQAYKKEQENFDLITKNGNDLKAQEIYASKLHANMQILIKFTKTNYKRSIY